MKPSRRADISPPPSTGQAQLGCGLRAVFEDVAASPLPKRLAELTEKLEEALERGELARQARKNS